MASTRLRPTTVAWPPHQPTVLRPDPPCQTQSGLAGTRATRAGERVQTPACSPTWPPVCRRRRRNCRRSISAISAAPSCSSRSPACRSITRPAPSAPCSKAGCRHWSAGLAPARSSSSVRGVPRRVASALRAGANGYIMKQEATENVLVALRRILRREVYVSDPGSPARCCGSSPGAGRPPGADLAAERPGTGGIPAHRGGTRDAADRRRAPPEREDRGILPGTHQGEAVATHVAGPGAAGHRVEAGRERQMSGLALAGSAQWAGPCGMGGGAMLPRMATAFR